MKYDPIKNPNYVATVVRVDPDRLIDLEGLDNLVGYTRFGMQALVSKDTEPGLYLLFSTEVQLAADFAKANNLYRDAGLNADTTKTGYLEQKRRVKAIKLRTHRSESLLIPVSSLSYLLSAKEIADLADGDVFDSINGTEVCRKYLAREPKPNSTTAQAKPRRRLVDERAFPEHNDSEAYFRNSHKIPADAHVVISQKLHGTSVRYGHVPALVEQKWWERLLRRPQRTEHRFVVGSRRVVKSVDLAADGDTKNHYYADGDLWTAYADRNRIAELIPKDHIVYGELVGFTSPGSEIQKGYTYGQADGAAELYVYRVAVVTTDGHVIDYTPEQMATFCRELDFKVVPVLWTGRHADFDATSWLERRYYDEWASNLAEFRDAPVPLSAKRTVDEGVCVRYDGPLGAYIVKAKSPTFIRHESTLLDAGTDDIEAEQDATKALVPA